MSSIMDESSEEVLKKTRRGKRGSRKKTALQSEISALVRNELQKYEKQMQKMSDMHSGLARQRRNKTRPTEVKRYRAEAKKMMRMKTDLMDQNHGPMAPHVHSQQQRRANFTGRSLDKQFHSSKRDSRARHIKGVLKDISYLKISSPEPQQAEESVPNLENIPFNEQTPKSFAFPKSIKKDKMREILKQQTKNPKEYITGTLRVNNKFPKYAYVFSEKDDEDIVIYGHCDRNRAMERDLVVIKMYPKDQWTQKANGGYQKTAFVVSILEKVHSRKAIGTLAYHKDALKFYPRDPKFPIMIIDPETLPEEHKDKTQMKKTLFSVKMVHWSAPFHCSGKILAVLGDVGDLEAETEAIVLENGLDVTPYDETLIKNLPQPGYVLQASDVVSREDWRSTCVFTIDPATAVDLDDAVSCRRLPNGNFEVGVHISDVTHFLKSSSPVDQKASKKATTIYLANTVHHMLPKPLYQLCSLTPGRDRLTFSVIWEITRTGDVVDHRFTRSIINSCCQLSYQQAQQIIETSYADWPRVPLTITKNTFTPPEICQAVNDLYMLSKRLRNNRFEDGALKIDQPKLHIVLDEVTKLPSSYCLEERLESNKLIEEFMLLANMAVAKHLYKKFPKTALLRHHDPPKQQSLTRAFNGLKNFGVHLNTESAGALQASMSRYEQTIERGKQCPEEEFVANSRMMVITSLCAQAMVRANYICSGVVKKKVFLKHYALNTPLYTHFTSPLRRYADCVIHRLLASSLDGSPLPADWSTDLCTNLANNCNRMKDGAKNAEEKSHEVYFTHLLAQSGPTETLGIVMTVRQHSLDVILCHVGLTIKLELSEVQKYADVDYNNDNSIETVRITWKEPEVTQVINVFTILTVRIRKHPKLYSIQGSLIPPKINY